jgi:hypothetical protein
VPVDSLASILVAEYYEDTKPAFYIRRERYRKTYIIIFLFFLYIVRVSSRARRSNAYRSIGFIRKGGTLLY